jgi:hypothetical protein
MFSPHAAFHGKASDLAIKASVQFLKDFRMKLNNETKIKKILRESPDGSAGGREVRRSRPSDAAQGASRPSDRHFRPWRCGRSTRCRPACYPWRCSEE